MDAKLTQRGDVSIVSISGFLDIERAQSFRDTCSKHLQKRKVIFNMKNACFVGSTGIKPILEIIQILQGSSNRDFKLVGVKEEFLKLMNSMNIETKDLELYEDENAAIESYSTPSIEIEKYGQ